MCAYTSYMRLILCPGFTRREFLVLVWRMSALLGLGVFVARMARLLAVVEECETATAKVER